jgi:hypothetical protein
VPKLVYLFQAMEEQILSEIIEVKKILSRLVGTSDLPKSKQFSTQALNRAAKEFKKLIKTENEWVKQYDLHTYFPDCGDGLGKFIREVFGFSNYFTQGAAIFYSRRDIVALSDELKSRNIELATYIKLRRGEAQLHKGIQTAALRKKAKGKKKSYKLEDCLNNIKISDYNFPERVVIQQEIKKLMQQFETNKLGLYINVFDDFAMSKHGSRMKDYVPEKARKMSRTWCNSFNAAHYALKLIAEHEQQSRPEK